MESTETVSFANIIETKCLWYSFSTILQNDLNPVKDHWNMHRIRKSRFQTIHGSLSDCNWTRTQNHLVRKRTVNHLAKLACGVWIHSEARTWYDKNLQLYMVGQMFFIKFHKETEVKKVWSLLYWMKCLTKL